MYETDELPDRPLAPVEVAKIATAEDIATAVPTVYASDGRSSPQSIVCVLLVTKAGHDVTVAWKANNGGWEVVSVTHQ